jgi:hypothetical protein
MSNEVCHNSAAARTSAYWLAVFPTKCCGASTAALDNVLTFVFLYSARGMRSQIVWGPLEHLVIDNSEQQDVPRAAVRAGRALRWYVIYVVACGGGAIANM